jgi:hypothetical protein
MQQKGYASAKFWGVRTTEPFTVERHRTDPLDLNSYMRHYTFRCPPVLPIKRKLPAAVSSSIAKASTKAATVRVAAMWLNLTSRRTAVQHKRTFCGAKIQYSTIQYSTVQYSTIQYSTIQYNTIQYNAVQYNTIQYNAVHYNTISTIQHNTIQYNKHNTI